MGGDTLEAPGEGKPTTFLYGLCFSSRYQLPALLEFLPLCTVIMILKSSPQIAFGHGVKKQQ